MKYNDVENLDEWQMWRLLAGQMSNVVVFGGRKQTKQTLDIGSVQGPGWRVETGHGDKQKYRGLGRADTGQDGGDPGYYTKDK